MSMLQLTETIRGAEGVSTELRIIGVVFLDGPVCDRHVSLQGRAAMISCCGRLLTRSSTAGVNQKLDTLTQIKAAQQKTLR